MTSMRLATWNVNSVRARSERLATWLRVAECDIICLQETKCSDQAFPTDVFSAAGYDVAHWGSGAYNGVAIASRVGIDDVVTGFGPGDERLRARAEPTWDPHWLGEPRALTATCGGSRVMTVYAPNGRRLDHPHYRYKLAWLDELALSLGPAGDHPDTVVCGDLNVTPSDADVHDPARWRGRVLASAPERARIAALVAAGWIDVWRARHPRPEGTPDPAGFTWWDHRGPDLGRGLRLDLVLAPPDVARRITDLAVDRDERGGARPSDHAPLVASLSATSEAARRPR